ncbi:MAG: carboxypeptidase-like regulatory domain-containing protein [Candidatus Cryptobacteroides sp.]
MSRIGTSAFAQIITVSGTVSDAQGTLPDIGVLVKGTTNYTVTDLSGQYQISCNSNAILVFSGVGYITKNVSVNNKRRIDVQLEFSDDVIIITPLEIQNIVPDNKPLWPQANYSGAL